MCNENHYLHSWKLTFSEVFFILPNLHKTADPMLTLLPSQVQTTPILFLVTCNSHSNLFLLHWWYSLSVLPLVLNFHTSALWTSLFLFFTLKNVRTTQTLNPIQQRRLGFAYIFFTPSLFSKSLFSVRSCYVICPVHLELLLCGYSLHTVFVATSTNATQQLQTTTIFESEE